MIKEEIYLFILILMLIYLSLHISNISFIFNIYKNIKTKIKKLYD